MNICLAGHGDLPAGGGRGGVLEEGRGGNGSVPAAGGLAKSAPPRVSSPRKRTPKGTKAAALPVPTIASVPACHTAIASMSGGLEVLIYHRRGRFLTDVFLQLEEKTSIDRRGRIKNQGSGRNISNLGRPCGSSAWRTGPCATFF